MDKSVLSNKPFLFILFTGFLAVMGIGIIIPVIPFIVSKYVDPHQASQVALLVGLLTSLYSFCQFFSAPVMGALSDKYGRRPVLLWSLLCSAAGYILFGIGGSLWILFLSRIIDGLSGGQLGAAMAYIADIVKPQERGKYFGVMGATVGLGFMLGPSLGGIVSHISLSAPLFLAAGLSLLNFVFGYLILPESLDKSNRMTDFSVRHLNPFRQLQYIYRHSLLRHLMFVGFFYFFAFAELQGITSVFYKDTLHWDATHIGFYFLLLGLGDMFTQGFLTGKLLPKLGALRLVLGGFLVTAFAYFINSIIPIYPVAALVFIYVLIYSLGSGFFEPSFGHLVSGAASPQEQGRVQGASQSMQSVTRIIGPVFAGLLYQLYPGLPWITCVAFSLIGGILLYQNQSQINKHISLAVIPAH